MHVRVCCCLKAICFCDSELCWISLDLLSCSCSVVIISADLLLGLLACMILKPGHMTFHLLMLVFATTFIMVCLMPALSKLLWFFSMATLCNNLLLFKGIFQVKWTSQHKIFTLFTLVHVPDLPDLIHQCSLLQKIL